MWSITPEITDEMARIKRREILSKYLRQLQENTKFGNGQLGIVKYQTSRSRQTRPVDKKLMH